MRALTQRRQAQTGELLTDRYPGAQPFSDTRVDHLRFFGRQEDTHALLHQLLSADLLVLFAKPGLGKTSLLQASLSPRLRERDFLPVPVRFNHPDAALTPMQVFITAVEQACTAEQIDYAPGDKESLWEFFKTAIFWRGDRLQTPVLILDQFEEIFVLQREAFRHAAAAEVGQLLGSRLPERVRRQLQAGQPLPFSEQPPAVKVLLSLREDELGLLQELTPEIPAILQHRFRLTGLSYDDARRAITEPASLVAEEVQFSTEPFTYDERTVDEMITTARNQDGHIDPFLLQILCSHVERQVRQRQAAGSPSNPPLRVDRRDLRAEQGQKAPVARFYLEALARLPRGTLRRRARRLCEEGLLTGEGRRRSLLQEDVEERFRLDSQALALLEQARLLRKEARHGGLYYEISHDRLAEAVRDERHWRLPPMVKIPVISVIVAAIALLMYDLYVNRAYQYLYISVQEGRSDNVELWQGKAASWDIFGLREYLAETDYTRSQLEPGLLFKERTINNRQQLSSELIGYLQLQHRAIAYWQDGQPDQAFASIRDPIERPIHDDPEGKQTSIALLADFRSLETMDLLERYLRDDEHKDLHEHIVAVMARLPHPRVLETLLATVQSSPDSPSRPLRVRRAAVQAVERMTRAGFGATHADRITRTLTPLLELPLPERGSRDEEILLQMLAAARTLTGLGHQEAVEKLRSWAKLTAGRNFVMQRGTVEALAGIKDTRAVALISDRLSNSRRSSFMPWGMVGLLGSLGGSDVVEKLGELIRHHSVNIRRDAVEALGRTGDPRAVQPLIDRLPVQHEDAMPGEDEPEEAETREDEPEVWATIAEGLGRLGNSHAFRPLLNHVLQVEDGSPMVRHAVDTLGRIGTADTCQMLLATLDGENNPRRRRVIIRVLGRLGDERAIARLQDVLKNGASDAIRQSAAEALAQLGAPAAVDHLSSLLKAEQSRVRLQVAGALGRLGHPDALALLRDLVRQGGDKQDPAYLAALEALGHLGDASALDGLTLWLQRGDSLMRRGNLEAMVGVSTAQWLESRIVSQSGEEGYVRQAAVESLGGIDSLRPLDLLMARLHDGSVFVRRGAARALGRLARRDVRAVDPLIAHLNDVDHGVRQYAAEALGRLGPRRAVAPLIAVLRDPHPDVRREAASALGRLGDERALPPLASQFRGRDDQRQEGVEDVRRAALLAYATIGLTSHAEPTRTDVSRTVSAVFTDASESERVRLAAAVALSALQPPDAPQDLSQDWLQRAAEGAEVTTHRRKELAALLGEFPTPAGTQRLLAWVADPNLGVRESALLALGQAHAQEALQTLHAHLTHPNFRIQRAAAEALADIASAESIPRLIRVATDSHLEVSIPTRLAGLQALYSIANNSQTTDASREKAIAALLEAVQREEDEAILGIRTYNLLGDLQARQALRHLQERLRQEEVRQREWRGKRNALENKDATNEQIRQRQRHLEQARSKPYLAFELAYNIARIDQNAGVALLHHGLADIRRGAALGLGRVGNVELIGRLRQARRQSDAPLFRHAAYRAIDHMLLRLETAEVAPQELGQLEALYPGEVETRCKQVSAPEEHGICLRVDWTIAQLQTKGAIHGQHPATSSAIQHP